MTFKGSGQEEERRIPLLNDVFRDFPSVPINIDIKADNDRLIKEVDNLIRKFDRAEITVWGSFSSEITYKCYLQVTQVNLHATSVKYYLLKNYFCTVYSVV